MYFLICWGHFISKITLLQYVIHIAFLWGSLMLNLSFTIKDHPFFPIRDRYCFFGGSLIVNLSFTIKDPPFFPIPDTYCFFGGVFNSKFEFYY